jgi:Ca2+-transporting ATPase
VIPLVVFVYALYSPGHSLEQARTSTFTLLVLVQLFHAFNCRSDRHSLFTVGIRTNMPLIWAVTGSLVLQAGIAFLPWAREIFDTAPLDMEQWIGLLLIGTLPLFAMEAYKTMKRPRGSPCP